MAGARSALLAPVLAYLERLRFPVLFGIVLALFAVDLVLPDGLPLVDEILLGLLAALLGRWRRRGGEADAGRAGRYSARSSSR